MITPPRPEQRCDLWLREAMAGKTPATLHVHSREGWSIGKTRLMPTQDDPDSVSVAWPREWNAKQFELRPGRSVGVSFRRGSHKCVFEAELQSVHDEPGSGRTMLTLGWPEEIQQLQRRLYSRSRVPDHLTIPVNVTTVATVRSTDERALSSRGILLDLSAGGMGVALPAACDHRWNRGDLMTCRVPLDPAQEPREVTGRLRHLERTSQGHVRLGLEFVGLETTATGLETLRCIARTTSRFRQAPVRRGWRHL